MNDGMINPTQDSLNMDVDVNDEDRVRAIREAMTPSFQKLYTSLRKFERFQPNIYEPDRLVAIFNRTQFHPSQVNSEKSMITFREALELGDTFSPSGSRNCEKIVNLFIQTMTNHLMNYSTIGDRGHPNPEESLRNFNLVEEFDPLGDGSCFFGALDYCLYGKLVLSHNSDEKIVSRDEEVAIRQKNIITLKENFADAIYRDILLLQKTNAAEAKNQMAIMVSDRGYYELENTVLSLPEEEFLSVMLELFPGFNDEELLRNAYKNQKIILEIEEEFELWTCWLKSSNWWSCMSPQNVRMLNDRGIKGILMPPGYMNKATQGGHIELKYIPKIFARQAICINLGGETHGIAGMDLRCSKTKERQAIIRGEFGDIMLPSVYTDESINILRTKIDPIVLVRIGGHYQVYRSTDEGERLLWGIMLAHCYYNMVDIFESKKQFLLKIAKMTGYNVASDPYLCNIAGMSMTEEQFAVIVHQTVEICKYQLGFLDIWSIYTRDCNTGKCLKEKVESLKRDCRVVATNNKENVADSSKSLTLSTNSDFPVTSS